MTIKHLLILLIFLSSIGIVASQSTSGVEIELPSTPQTIYTLEKTYIDITIKNTGVNKDTFYISVWPSNWVSLEKYFVTLNGGQSGTVKLTIEPPIDSDAGNVVFTVSARSIDTGASTSKDMILNIRRKTGAYISSIKLNQELVKPGDTLSIQPVLVNLDKTQSRHVIVLTKILKDGMSVYSFDSEVLLEPDKTKTLTLPFFVYNKYVYGIYTIDVLMTDQFGQPIHRKTTSFGIQKFDDIKTEKSVEGGFLYRIITINITNKGNIPDSSYVVTESIPRMSKYFFDPDVEPTSEERKDDRIVYSWIVSGLNPDESRIIKYQFRYSNIVILSGIVFLLLIIAVSYYYKPALIKRYSGLLSQEKETVVTLHIKNNSTREIYDVIVRDHVPPVAVVVKEFDTLVPEIRRTHNGTSLVWKIDKLKSKEERILTYKIKPVIDVEGRFKFPKARFSYKSGKNIINKIADKIIISVKKIK
ncbi:MAG: hypothetical protein ACK4MM_05420 [Fervidobacterium sp.]